MNGVSGSTFQPLGVPGAGAVSPGAAPVALLPTAGGRVDIGDAVGALLAASAQINAAQTSVAKGAANSAAAIRKHAVDEQVDILKHAIEAARKAAEAKSEGGLFDFIEDKLGIAGLIGISVVVLASTGGLGATALAEGTSCVDLEVQGLALALEDFASHLVAPHDATNALDGAAIFGGAATFAVDQLVQDAAPEGVRSKLDTVSIKDDDIKLAKKIALAAFTTELAIAETVATAGTGAAGIVAVTGIGVSTATNILQETRALKAMFGEEWASKVAIGGQIAGTLTTLVGSGMAAWSAPGAMGKIATAAENAQQIAEGAFEVNQGFQNLRAAGYQHDADLLQADAQERKNTLATFQRIIDDIIDDLKSMKESAQRTTTCLHETLQTQNQTLLIEGSLKV